MKRSLSQLILLSLILEITLQQKCSKSIQVKSIDGPDQIETICLECRIKENSDFYSVNDNYQACIGIKSFSYNDEKKQPPLTCKRVNDRFTCQEALFPSHVLKQNNHSIAQISNLKCAIISDDLSTCVMPKFGYTLNLPSSQFSLMNEQFCAIFETEKCIKYHHRFLPVKDKGYSVFFKDFINFDKIIHKESHSTYKVCEKNYQLQTLNNVEGCFLSSNSVTNCKQYDKNKNCEQCMDGYAINAITEICEKSTLEGCLIQNTLNNQQICQKCQQGYVVRDLFCKKLQNCQIQSFSPPYNCLICKSPYYGSDCQKQITDSNNKCELFQVNIEDKTRCIKCQNNENFYYNTNEQACKIREKSTNCKVKHPRDDSCGKITESEMYYYSAQTSLNFISQQQYSPYNPLQQHEFIQNPEQFAKNYLNQLFKKEQDQNPELSEFYDNMGFSDDGIQKYIHTYPISPIGGCLQYSNIADACIKCDKDLNRLFFDGKFICSKDIPTQQIDCLLFDEKVKNCVLCNAGYYNSYSDQQSNTCLKSTVEHCVYQLNQTCMKCEEGYQFDDKRQCIKISNFCKDLLDYRSGNIGCDQCFQGPSFNIAKTITGKVQSCTTNNSENQNCSIIYNQKCSYCFEGYTFNEQTSQCIQSDQLQDCLISNNQNTCISCRKNYELEKSKCIPIKQEIPACRSNIIPHCGECFNEKCTKCSEEGFLLQDNICLYQCEDGSLKNEYSQCPKSNLLCDSNCLKCSLQQKCLQCNSSTYLLNGGCYQGCPPGYFIQSNICQKCSSNCLKCQNSEQCQQCIYPYSVKDRICQLSCRDGRVVKDQKECNETSCEQKCLKCLDTNLDVCLKCKNENDIIFQGKCLGECPNGYFNSKNQCQLCPDQCLTCSSQDKCLSCTVSGAQPENNCLCKNEYFLYDNKCMVGCPPDWKRNYANQKCERICQNQTYPVYSTLKKDYECRSIQNDQDAYCVQLIEQIPYQVKFELQKVNVEDNNIVFFSILNETPEQCYTYKLFGKESFEIPIQKLQNTPPNQMQFSAIITKKDFLNSEKVQQDDKHSFLFFKIYYQNLLQYTIRAKITFTFDLILSNEISFKGDRLVYDPLCESCEVPVEKKVSSTSTAKCPSDTTCEDNKISVFVNSEIEITQKINDPKYQTNTMHPHSVQLKLLQNGKDTFLQIKNYQYDNTESGKITYKFKTIGDKNGQLIITSKVYLGTSILRTLQENSQEEVLSSNYYYSTDRFKIELNDEDDDSQSNKLLIIIISVLSSLLLIFFVLLILICLVYRKRKLNNINNNSLNTSNSNLVELVRNNSDKSSKFNSSDY